MLPQAAADTLGLVHVSGYLLLKIPTGLAWVLFAPLALGVYGCVQCVVAVATACYDKLRRVG